jgi:hypothetical protein
MRLLRPETRWYLHELRVAPNKTGRPSWSDLAFGLFVPTGVFFLAWWKTGEVDIGLLYLVVGGGSVIVFVLLRWLFSAPVAFHAAQQEQISDLNDQITVLRRTVGDLTDEADARQQLVAARQWLRPATNDLEDDLREIERQGENQRNRGGEFYLADVKSPTEIWLVEAERRLREAGLEPQAEQLHSQAHAFRSMEDVDEALKEARRLILVVNDNLRIGFYGDQ